MGKPWWKNPISNSVFGLWRVITVTGHAYLCVHSWGFFPLVLILSAHYLNQICSMLFGFCFFSSCHLSTDLSECSAALCSPVKKKHSSDLGPFSNSSDSVWLLVFSVNWRRAVEISLENCWNQNFRCLGSFPMYYFVNSVLQFMLDGLQDLAYSCTGCELWLLPSHCLLAVWMQHESFMQLRGVWFSPDLQHIRYA